MPARDWRGTRNATLPAGGSNSGRRCACGWATQAGSLDLAMAAGPVTTADDGGIFDGVLAGVSVGQPGPVAFALPSRIDIGLDFSSIGGSLGGPETELEHWLTLHTEGAAMETERPEPVGLGIIPMAVAVLVRRRSR